MTVIAIEAFGPGTTRVTFTDETRRDTAVATAQAMPRFAVLRATVNIDPGRPTATFSTNPDDTEYILRDAGVTCRMLIDILDEAAAKHGFGAGDAGRAGAWSSFVRSASARAAIKNRWPDNPDAYQQSIEVDSDREFPLDKTPDQDFTRSGRWYRDLSRSRAFIDAGEEWLASLPKPAP